MENDDDAFTSIFGAGAGEAPTATNAATPAATNAQVQRKSSAGNGDGGDESDSSSSSSSSSSDDDGDDDDDDDGYGIVLDDANPSRFTPRKPLSESKAAASTLPTTNGASASTATIAQKAEAKAAEGSVAATAVKDTAALLQSVKQKLGVGLEVDESMYDVDMQAFEDAPWRKPGADLSDYFNYGFDEISWKVYQQKQKALRLQRAYAQKSKTIGVFESGQGGAHSNPPLVINGGGMRVPQFMGSQQQQPQQSQTLVQPLQNASYPQVHPSSRSISGGSGLPLQPPPQQPQIQRIGQRQPQYPSSHNQASSYRDDSWDKRDDDRRNDRVKRERDSSSRDYSHDSKRGRF